MTHRLWLRFQQNMYLIFYVFFHNKRQLEKLISIKENPLRHHLNGNQSPKLTKNEALDLILRWFYPNLGFIAKVLRILAGIGRLKRYNFGSTKMQNLNGQCLSKMTCFEMHVKIFSKWAWVGYTDVDDMGMLVTIFECWSQKKSFGD